MTLHCPHCNQTRMVFIKRQTNTDKYFCRHCRKTSIVPIAQSPAPERVTGADYSGLPPGKVGFMCFNHQGKANKFLDALNHGGKYVLLDQPHNYRSLKFVLTDTDIMGRRHGLEKMRIGGVKRFFVYPHAARPDLVNDIYPEWAHVSAHFVVTEAHAEVMRAYGYSRPLVPVGWSLCPIREFQPRKEPKNVLFAPIHPRCSAVDQDVNRATFNRLEKLARAGHINLIVRFIADLPKSGLERVEHPNIKYTPGAMNQMYDQIDNADVVIATQTFLYLAVARGVPAIGFAQDLPTHIQERSKSVLWVRNWKKYAHLMIYPFDILQAPDPLALMEKAVRGDPDIYDWRSRMIGQPFRRDRFVKKLEEYL